MRLLRTLRRHRLLTVGGLALVIVAGGGYMFVHAGSSTTQYRTASVTLGTIQQTLSLTGNLSPISQSNVNFQVSGTVTAIDVSLGQTVTAGQILATVDASTMQSALTQAQATLAAAQAKLAADQSSGSSTTAAENLATARTNLSNDTTAYRDTLAVNAQTIASDQRTITSDQSAVSSDSQAVSTAQQRYNADGCSGSSSAPCQSDAQSLSAAQQQLTKDTQALTTADTASPTDRVRAQQADDQAAARVASDQTALNNALSSSSSSSSAATLQAAIAQDTASVAQAQQTVTNDTNSVNESSLLAPAGGTVAAINVTVGNAVTTASSSASAAASNAASSTGANFIILTPGSFQVTGTISDSQVNQVAIGQHAVVTAAGTASGLPGTVTSVGQIATVASGVATFPVTVQVTGTHPALRDGMSATISVIINQVVGVLTVPSSAVHTNGTTSTVQVLNNGVPSSVIVTTGAADSSRTEIQSGLTAGETVVIATVSSTVPTPSTTTRGGTRTFGGGGAGGLAAPGG
jgi:multidrug efflux pump subunit AcrA (membrane-fusion protein)